MTNKIIFFLPKKTMNEATVYYVDILKHGFIKAGYSVEETEDLSDLKKINKIFVMSAKWCFIVKLFNPKAKIVTWFQGLGAEEALMTRNSLVRKRLWNCVEFFALKFSWINIYVSERMHNYYQDIYRVKDKNFFIMPCFNKKLNEDAFNLVDKYDKPSFVYAGGLDKWQCIEETLDIFCQIEKSIPAASLTLLTKDKIKAEELIKRYNIKNYKISFVSLNELDAELMKYKYGFLIRQDHIVNNVSTPTKMNSYLANGVIPIYTNVIDDFNENIRKSNYFVMLNAYDTVKTWKETITRFDSSSSLIDFKGNFLNEVRLVFLTYYNQEKYILNFSDFLKKIG
jgi:hypothetical protein